jgi:hypothetical protein
MGDYACVAGIDLGVIVLNVSDPAHPRQVGRNSAWPAHAVVWRDGTLFVAAGQDGFVIAEMRPFFKSISRGLDGIELSWEGYGSAQLQTAADLLNPQWQGLPGSEETNGATLPAEGGAKFFRLVGQ